jgi:hypothetical protein
MATATATAVAPPTATVRETLLTRFYCKYDPSKMDKVVKFAESIEWWARINSTLKVRCLC